MFQKFNVLSYTLLSVLAVNLLATSGDITMTWTSPMFPKLKMVDPNINPLPKPLTAEEDALIASLINIGAIIGPFPYGFIGEKFGRKPALLSVAVPHIISYVTFAFAKNVYLFYFGRLLGGLAVGGGYTLMPMYVAEIAPDSNRGTLSLTLNIFWAFGNFIPLALGPYISIFLFNLILACIPAVFFVMFLLVAPESPYYLVSANKIEEAEKTIMKLRDLDEKCAKKEVEHIQSMLQSEEKGKILDLFRNRITRKALVLCVSLILLNQLSGVNTIGFYLQPVFQAAHTDIDSSYSSTISGLALFLTALVSPFFVDTLGRRFLLVVSSFSISLCLTCFGAFFFLQDKNIDTTSISWLPILSLILSDFAYNFGIACVPWTVSSEIFPNNVKSLAVTLVACSCAIFSFILTQFFNDMVETFKIYGVVWFFAGSCLLGGILCFFFIPETKGKSLKEIQEILNK